VATVGSKGDVSVRIGTQYDSEGVDAAKGGMNDFGKSSSSISDKIKSQWERLRKHWLIATAALTGTILAIKQLSASILEAASTSEQYEIRLQHLLGSQAEGTRLFKEMAEYAGKVPFEFEQIMGAATQLSGIMKGGVDEIKEWMPMIGDLAAVSGMSIQETTEQVSRMYASGAASADMFRERGILSMLGFEAGVSYSAEETRRKLMESWNKQGSQFKGATKDLSGSWDGMMSMMSDAWFAFRMKIAEAGIFNFIKAGVGLILKKIEELKAKGKLDVWAKRISDGIITGFGMAIETLRFFHNGWLGLKMAGTAVIMALVDMLHLFNRTLEVVIGPLADLGVQFDLIDTNPFEAASEGSAQLKEDVRVMGGSILDDIESTNAGYDAFKEGIAAAREEMERLNDAQIGGETAPGTMPIPPSVMGAEEEDPETNIIKIRMQYREAEIEQMTMFSDIMAYHAERGVAISGEMAARIMVDNQKMAWSAEARSRLTGVANQAMQKQMLSLIETGKFSLKAMAQIMAQQVKIELAGIAAKAAIQAIYYGARGLAATAMGDPMASAWFAAAGQMALIAGAAAAAGAAVSAIAGGQAEKPAAGTAGGEPIQTTGGDNVSSVFDSGAQPQQPTVLQKTYINVEGHVVDLADFARKLIPSIEEAKEDGV